MIRERPIQLIVIGMILVIAAWVLPFLMVLHIVPSTFLLDFLVYGAGVAGLFMGIIGAAMYVQVKKPKVDEAEEPGEAEEHVEEK